MKYQGQPVKYHGISAPNEKMGKISMTLRGNFGGFSFGMRLAKIWACETRHKWIRAGAWLLIL